MENCMNMDGGGDEKWKQPHGSCSLRQLPFLGNRSSVHVIRPGLAGVRAAFFSIYYIDDMSMMHAQERVRSSETRSPILLN